MPVISNILNIDIILAFGKGAILLILIFYAIFSVIIVRQVDLMSKTFHSWISGYIRVFSIIHAFFALGLIVLAWEML